MSDLNETFERAVEEVKTLPGKPANETLLRLYSLYKQATMGDVSGEKPGFTDFVGRAKYDAWEKLKGESKEGTMQKYIALVEELKG